MPRGYLKRSSRAVGKKAARGGSSKRTEVKYGCGCKYCVGGWEPKDGLIRRRLAQVDEDDLFDCNDFCREDCLYDGDWNQSDSHEQKTVSRGPPILADFTSHVFPNSKEEDADTSITVSLALSEADSYSFCVDTDEESAFSLLGSVAGSEVQTSSTKENDMTLKEAKVDEAASIEEEMSYVDIDTDTDDDVKSSFSFSSSGTFDLMSLDSPIEASCSKLVPDTLLPKAMIEEYKSATPDLPSDCLRCAICLEEKPLLKLMKNCRHPSACHECLRMMYITKPQEACYANYSETGHIYPLKCYWPNCGRILRDTQIKKLAENQRELRDHYSCESRAKGIRKREIEENIRKAKLKAERVRAARRVLITFSRIHSCPGCGHNNTLLPYRDLNDHTTPHSHAGGVAANNEDNKNGSYCRVVCVVCSQPFQVDRVPPKEILSVVAALGGWDFSICPSCGTFVVKDGGCDHMTCHCGTHFSYDTGNRMNRS